MEGSNKIVSQYEYLSKYYDYLLGDEEAFSLWLNYIEEDDFKTCLELASGSGVMAKLLKQKGYDVIASDISEEMAEAAKNNFDGEYLILNMINFDIDKKFDLILCICDSLNYLYSEELLPMFKNVYEHLNPNGRFIFDMHHPKRIEEFKKLYEARDTENDLITYTVSPHGLYTCSQKCLEQARELALEYNLPVHVHFLESIDEI